jgi:uncharacterized beta-barrel protein YwiB (DUF1934 family)
MGKTNAWLTIEGQQWSGEEPADILKVSTEGAIIRKPDSWDITYEESPATGLDGTHTTVQVEDSGAISLIRTGTHSMFLTFVEGSRHISRLETPYGNLDVGIYTSSARAELTEAGGRIHLGYTIDFNNREPMNTSLDIIVRMASGDGPTARPSAKSVS